MRDGTGEVVEESATHRGADEEGPRFAHLFTEHPEVAFVAAITGPTNLFASILCRDTPHLHRYVTERLGALAGITDLEVTPALRVLKQAQTLLDSDRVAYSL